MSTSAIVPISSTDFNASASTSTQQSAFQGLIGQLEQSIGGGDLTTSQTVLNAIEALSPSSVSANNALGTFLTGVSKALDDNSVSEAQSALAAYLQALQGQQAQEAATSTSTSPSAIASGLVLSQIQLNLVSSLLGVDGNSDEPSSSSSSSDNLLDILNAAYSSNSDSQNNSLSQSNAVSPYDALVSAIQSNLTSGSGIANTLLEYLGSTGNLISTFA